MPEPTALLDTPFVSIDLDIVNDNLRRMQNQATQAGLALRPHTKTHKQPWLAREQVALGASGITVAKLDEADVMLSAGLTDVLIAYPLVGKTKAHRLATLMMRGLNPLVSLDSVEALDTVARAGEMAGRPVDVLVEVDTGFHRCGLDGGAVVELAERVHQTSGARLKGLMSYAGHVSHNSDVDTIIRLIKSEDDLLGGYVSELTAHRLPVDVVTVGGTILSNHMDEIKTATEVRPGIYVFNDMGIVNGKAATVSQCAARIWATIVSQPAPDRLVLDAGSKMLSTDGPINEAYGLVVEHPEWHIARLSEEHAVVKLPSPTRGVVGERVSVIPNHVCTVMNLQNQVVGVSKGEIAATLPIMARGGTR